MRLLIIGICVLAFVKISDHFTPLSRQEKEWDVLKKKMIESDKKEM